MASLTVRNLPDEAKLRFRQAAAAHGRSMEEHLRQLIIEAAGMGSAKPAVADASVPFQGLEPDAKAESRARIEKLIEAGRGIGWEPEPRSIGTIKETDFS
ncbi:hypothetical protein [Blastomonas sp. AAP53]|uniref:FitA-like ribbon-helix-helix domain-containing protein n=1 Tax=Blastomonas sp. AAP53 TaxID=1248760 RepID=UPI0003058350|nr:hypothetical protein [Blastomonas sp. AAP53]